MRFRYLYLLLTVIIALLGYFFHSEKRFNKVWLICVGLFPLIIIFLFNPNIRIFSWHSFMHTGIVYQILNGNIPPLCPLLSGFPLHYLWGYHCVIAMITKLFNITPFYAFPILNIVSLIFAMILVFKISKRLIPNEKANIFSVIFSIFGFTVIDSYINIDLLHRYLHFHFPLEHQGIPIFEKFTSFNGDPLGIVFFLLFVYALIKVFDDINLRFNAGLLFFALAGSGFFYPIYLPGIALSLVFVCAMSIFTAYNAYNTNGLFFTIKKVVVIGLISLSALILLFPYLYSITGGFKSKVHYFDPTVMLGNLAKYLTVATPMLLITFVNTKFLRQYTNRNALKKLLMIILATCCGYITMHMVTDLEHKLLDISAVTLGLVGGISFYAMRQRFNKLLIFVLMLLFLAPVYRLTVWKLFLFKNLFDVSQMYTEKGTFIYLKNNQEEQELYDWIRTSTDTKSIFIDSALTIPVFAQRQLYIGYDNPYIGYDNPEWWENEIKDPVISLGYIFTVDYFLRKQWCYEPEIINERQKIIKDIYDFNANRLSDEEVAFLQKNIDIYIVIRMEELKWKFNNKNFKTVFVSTKGNFVVYQPISFWNNYT